MQKMFKELFDLSRLVVGRTKFKGQKDSLPLYLGFEVDDNSVHKIMFIISTNSYEARFLYKVIEDKTTTSAQVLSIPRGLNEFREVFTSTDNDKVDQFEGSSVVMFIYPISGQFILYLFSPGMVVLGCDPGVVNSATMVGGVCQQDDSGRLRVPHTRTFKFNARLI